jgi:squalene-hopene/tetraprenyl-beta-curcumene cyclase
VSPDLRHRAVSLLDRLRSELLAEAGPDGVWTGHLSSSALSTATAVIALSALDRSREADPIDAGLRWLAENANCDGGWGDTTRSISNLSTTALVWAAFGAARADRDGALSATIRGAEAWIQRAAGSLDGLVPAIEAKYGRDRTFSVPITMALALGGRLGDDPWRRVRRLPFELAALPRGFFGAMRLPVVSYALPALIAIGQVVHHHRGGFHPVRNLTRRRTLSVLDSLQPENGGFLEATPLTSFVTMALAGMGLGGHPVARRGAAFLRASRRPDGSWPIDTNLSTWVTTLSVKALTAGGDPLDASRRAALREALLARQLHSEHPYTGAAPGAWAWTDLPGGVPDADDTAGALLALAALEDLPPGPGASALVRTAAAAGVQWLLDLQNGDGGMPTFCRGWGALPFDRSTPELTAHALRAWRAWAPAMTPAVQVRIRAAVARAMTCLSKAQSPEGGWVPLWFGNEAAPNRMNPVYGTAHVLSALEPDGANVGGEVSSKALRWLCDVQSADGGWGGDKGVTPSVEETAVALTGLAHHGGAEASIEKGLSWLVAAWESKRPPEPAPIGLYFAELWYFERLYPLIFSVEALGRVLRCGD